MIASSFELLRSYPVPSLGVELVHYRHACGAEHWHLANADEHRAFVVAFRTPPADSSGLPHILEHTTLCGSRRFPVRDPFFQMLRRSLQTFMNAMTFPDLTAYPFATQVAKDYDNLLAVYLDAVFAPNLHQLDFAQEGHRLEPEGEHWVRKGVVYNEMKGAMDSTDAQLEAARERVELADTIYRHNSGGEPADIPRLTHRELLAFHRRCYRPANACFITYGNADPLQLHAALVGYLGDEPGQPLPPPSVSQLRGPFAEQEVAVPLATGQDALDVTAITLSWLQGDSGDLDEVLNAELIDRLLLGHAGAPLRKVLEGSALGRSIGRSGYSSSYRSGLFIAELEGLAVADYPRFVPMVDGCLRQVVAEGVLPSEVDAALHQLELARREISGDHYPYGLELCFRLIGPWNLGVDPLPFLDQAPALARLAERSRDPRFVIDQVRTRLLDNPRRLLLRASPDAAFHTRMRDAEARAVAADVSALSPRQVQELQQQARELASRQARQDDPTVLPDLELSDIPPQRRWAEGRRHAAITAFVAGTNGVLHELVAFEIPSLSGEELDLLPILPRLIGGLGVGKLGYDEQAAMLNRICGGIWAWTDIIADPEDERRLRGLFIAETKGLASRSGEFLHRLPEALLECRFDELDRLRELVEESVQRLHGAIQHQGNRMAARAAMRGMGGAAALPHRLAGLGALATLKSLSARIASDAPQGREQCHELARRLERLLSRLIGGGRHLSLIGDAAEQAEALAVLRQSWSLPSPADPSTTTALTPPPALVVQPTAYLTASAVNYCALAFPTVGLEHPDAAALAVAGTLMTNNVLHPKLREQGGAYGGGASYQSASATFALTSYRDPRLDATYADMRDALRWLASCPDDARLFKEAILGVIAHLDAPASPAGEARNRFLGDLKGVGPALLNAHRARVLAVTAATVRAAAAAWLPAEGGVRAVVTAQEQAGRSTLPWITESV